MHTGWFEHVKDWERIKGLAEASGVETEDIGGDAMAEIPSYQLPASLEDGQQRCHFCGQTIRWGLTHKGKKAPFDAEPPHQNHWGTCPEHKKAREKFPR